MKSPINKLKKIFKFDKTISYEKKGINPKKDWRSILIVTFITLVFGGLATIYFHFQIRSGNLFNVEYGSEESISLNKRALDKVIDSLGEKKGILENIENGNFPSSDPSR